MTESLFEIVVLFNGVSIQPCFLFHPSDSVGWTWEDQDRDGGCETSDGRE